MCYGLQVVVVVNNVVVDVVVDLQSSFGDLYFALVYISHLHLQNKISYQFDFQKLDLVLFNNFRFLINYSDGLTLTKKNLQYTWIFPQPLIEWTTFF